MNCPHCSVNLNMMMRDGVEIDYCPKCRGVWLDRGELDKLLELVARPAVGGQQRGFQNDHFDDDDDSHDDFEQHRPYGRREDGRRPQGGSHDSRDSFFGRFFNFD